MTSAPLDSASPLLGVSLLRSLADNWWVMLLRGLVAIAFGVSAFIWPGLTLIVLTYLWGAYAIVDGVLALWLAISGKTGGMAPRWWLALVGVLGVAAGVIAFVWPLTAAFSLLIVIAVWAIAVGLLQIWGAIKLRKVIDGEWMLGLSGLLLIAFGAALLFWPVSGALSVVWLIGLFAVLAGASYVGLAFRLKKLKGRA